MMVTLFDQAHVTEIHEYNIRRDALLEGRQEGRQEGIEIGQKRGQREGTAMALRNLMSSLGLSAEQAMDALQIPESERPAYRAMFRS